MGLEVGGGGYSLSGTMGLEVGGGYSLSGTMGLEVGGGIL